MSPARIGPVSQRDLVRQLVPLIDAAMANGATAHRDLARAKLRDLLVSSHWRTTYVMRNLNPKRCRYLASIGFWVPTEMMWRPYTKVDERAENLD